MSFIVILFAGVFALFYWGGSGSPVRMAQRKKFIESYSIPLTVSRHLAAKYPSLDEAQRELVLKGLKDYFHITNIAGKRMVAMPSQAVDVAWHEFILFTREYSDFCRQAFGRFLHHTPAEAMREKTDAQEGIKTAWRLACRREGIDPGKPAVLPLLFALDAALSIPDGFHYSLDCMGQEEGRYCASHIGCGSGGCGGDSSGDSGGCGGGCGGGD